MVVLIAMSVAKPVSEPKPEEKKQDKDDLKDLETAQQFGFGYDDGYSQQGEVYSEYRIRRSSIKLLNQLINSNYFQVIVGVPRRLRSVLEES